MKPPSVEDRIVQVTAKLTDETFGYEHWRAGQFSFGGTHDAVLVICRAGEDRKELAKQIEAAIAPWTVTRA